MSKYGKIINSPTSQTEKLNDSQVENNAGGFVFNVGMWNQFKKFLILGSAEGTYYVNSKKLTTENVSIINGCLSEDFNRALNLIVDVSEKGLAPKQDSGIFALALASSFKMGQIKAAPLRAKALSMVNRVCRTGTTFFQFLDELKSFRSLTGRQVKRMISSWYQLDYTKEGFVPRSVENLSYQLVKYRNREGWTHKDAILLGHVKPLGKDISSVLKWASKNEWDNLSQMPSFIEGFIKIQESTTLKEVCSIIENYKLPREAVPTQFLNKAQVWEALLPSMGLTALIRNLGNMTSYDLLTNTSDSTRLVLEKLDNQELLKKARIHPIQVLMALKTYQKGAGFKGSNRWTPVQSIVGKLDQSFYKTFQYSIPTNKRVLIGLDVSGSMGSLYGEGVLTAAEVGAAISMYFLRTEQMAMVMGFSNTFKDLGFNSSMDLNTILSITKGMNFGATDCSLPFTWADANKERFDLFITITDNETWFGGIHPVQALNNYRSKYVKDARSIILATTPTKFTINDPADPLGLDIAGFSSDVPSIITEFARGNV